MTKTTIAHLYPNLQDPAFCGVQNQIGYTLDYCKEHKARIEADMLKNGEVFCSDCLLLKPPAQDNVNSPKHYQHIGIETIDYLEAITAELTGTEAVCTANAVKYLSRWKRKNGAEDIKKAIWYCQRLLKSLEKK
jgi:hypothetical protein